VRREAAEPKPGDIVADKYRLEVEIGRGGMGIVFGATHQVTGRRFAIKWLLPQLSDTSDAHKRFIRESQVSGRVQHPNLVEVFDIGTQDGAWYLVMEWLDGEPLSDRVERMGRLSVEEVCGLLLPAMHAVSAVHDVGIVHRDLKPSNLFICTRPSGTGGTSGPSNETVKVLDFGISKHTYATGMNVTRTGTVVGTPYYMSPEQIRGEQVDHRTDIYAFGVILYELLAGSVPFNANNFAELVVALMSATPKALSQLREDVPAELNAVVARAMTRDRAERYQTLPELIEALEPYTAQTALHASRVSAAGGGRSAVAPVWSVSRPPSAVRGSSASSASAASESSPAAQDPYSQSASRRVSLKQSGEELAGSRSDSHELDASAQDTRQTGRGRSRLGRATWAFVLVLGVAIGLLGWMWFVRSDPADPVNPANPDPNLAHIREQAVVPTRSASVGEGAASGAAALPSAGEASDIALTSQRDQNEKAAHVEPQAAPEKSVPPSPAAASTRRSAGHPLTRNARQVPHPPVDASQLPPAASSPSDTASPDLTPAKSHDPRNPLKSMRIK